MQSFQRNLLLIFFLVGIIIIFYWNLGLPSKIVILGIFDKFGINSNSVDTYKNDTNKTVIVHGVPVVVKNMSDIDGKVSGYSAKNYISKDIKSLGITAKPFSPDVNRMSRQNMGTIGNTPGSHRKMAGVKILKYHYFICPDPLGRLGNMMFEFAASFGIAHTLGFEHITKPSHTLVNFFEIERISYFKLKNLLTINENQWRSRKWSEMKKYLTHNLTLKGYFQSFKYFHNASYMLRKQFTVRRKFLSQAEQFLRNNTPVNKTLIGIHVRRGDFLSKVSESEGRVVANREFLIKSRNFFQRKFNDAFFVVVSDDKDWCKENINGSNIIFSPFNEPITDMAILSLCNHTIITSGSFGWWGAWLSNGLVIYLKDFPKSGTKLDKYYVRDEYYFPHWIGMSNG